MEVLNQHAYTYTLVQTEFGNVQYCTDVQYNLSSENHMQMMRDRGVFFPKMEMLILEEMFRNTAQRPLANGMARSHLVREARRACCSGVVAWRSRAGWP